MKKAIQIGAGNIGRGFIGAVLSKAGYNVVFADVDSAIVDRLNADGAYTVHIVDINSRDITISGVSAFNSADVNVMAGEIAGADLVTTAVGVGVLPYLAPGLAAGIAERRARGVDSPLNIIACENALRATSCLKEAVYALLSEEDRLWTEGRVGFVDCAVDRIVPAAAKGHPTDANVEEYYEWDVERAAFAGEVPEIEGMTPVDNLEAYTERKLFTLNTGHAITAYLGALRGHKTIDESIADVRIFPIVNGAMMQSGDALIQKFGFDTQKHRDYIRKVTDRFRNPHLHDDVMRVGRQPLRKLSRSDRLIKPMMTAVGFGLPHDCLAIGAAAALHFNCPDDPQSVELQKMIAEDGVEKTVAKVCGLEPENPLVKEIADFYQEVENI